MIDVAIDSRTTRRMSEGTRAYRDALLAHLPAVAPDLRIAAVGGGENLTLDEFVGLPLRLVRARPRMIHYPTIFAPPLTPARYVVTIHDLIHLRHPEFFSRGPALYYAAFARRLARHARLVLVGDERTVADCERYLGVSPARCRVVPLGYDPAMLEVEPVSSERPYLFYAGNHRPHKNLEVLFAAWRDLPERVELDLVCTGEDRTGAAERYRRTRGRLHFAGHLQRAEPWRTYRGAFAYVQPALAEGFGIPMLEALALGTPVVASDESVPGIVRPYAERFAARDASALRERLLAIVDDPSAARARAAEGARAVRAYTWDRFAAQTAAVYREVLK